MYIYIYISDLSLSFGYQDQQNLQSVVVESKYKNN